MPHTITLATKCRIAWAVVGAIVGFGIFGSFGFYFQNWHCAAWGLASGLFAVITLGVHVEYCQHEWNRKPNLLRLTMLVGCVIQLGAVAAFAVYLALAIVNNQKLTPYYDGYYVTCVWCLMTWKWAFLLFYFSRFYRKIIVANGALQEQPQSSVNYQRI